MGYHYRYQHEFIVYGVKPTSSRAKRTKSNNIPDIWAIRRLPPNQMVHPTEKPIELFDRIFLESAEEGDTVVDLFLGSGPSMCSTHAKNLNLYGFEIDRANIELMKKRFVNDSDVEFVDESLMT